MKGKEREVLVFKLRILNHVTKLRLKALVYLLIAYASPWQ